MESAFSKDNWHRQAASIAIRNSIRARRWGMRVTVYTGGSAGDYVLSYGLVDTNLQNNANWLLVAAIGATWGGGGGSSTPVVEYFTGDGIEDEFTISDAAGVIQFVEVGGQVMQPGVDYTIAGPVITFTSPPANGIDIGVYYWASASVVTDFLQEVTVDTSGASITLDMNSLKQRMFVGSATIATPKDVALSNNGNALVYDFHFEISNVAGVLTFPDTLMADQNWDDLNKQWTPPATGLYEGGATFDGTNWKLKINGPFF